MSFYPQLGSGAVTQFPFRRTRQWRAITNQLESGEQIAVSDSAGGEMSWSLQYEDLTNSEVQAISDLFDQSQGQFGAFTFVDPMANLLGWSENLSNAAWQSTELSLAGGAPDPLGTQRATVISNYAAGPISFSQTLGISGDYVSCFSAYVRASSSQTIALQRDRQQTAITVTTQWKRIFLSGKGTPGAAQSTFSIVLAPGQEIGVFGLQAEAQPWPSAYKPTSAAAGIYEETYFAGAELTVTAKSMGLSRASINLISRI
jgi:hypothetical protein